ncbi:T9SS type A sorting domain-containing protein [Flavicella sediminum]|uniref:T9SS type A sorting domain-containing protein n=1 Tax=Flavicella sediminum TaxID=2585141 RepID=UPI0011230B8A|nr:T9SS type A sorting domain-containing protein [Flavicella sediminum]
MKKITLKLVAILFFLVAVGVSAQTSVSVSTINGEDPATFKTNNPSLTAGTELSIVLEYTNVQDNGGGDNIFVRMLDVWDVIAGTQVNSTVANDAGALTTTLTITVPSINPGTTDGKIQAGAWNGSAYVFGTVTGLTIEADDVEINTAVSITSINGSSSSVYHTSVSGNLTEGETLTIGVDYTAIKADPGRADVLDVRVRFLTSGYGAIAEATTGATTVTNSDSSQSTTVSLTVPDLDETLTGVRIQVLGYGYTGSGDGLVFSYVSDTFTIDSETLALSEVELDDVKVYGNTIHFTNEYLKDGYSIYNISGQVVQTGSIDGTEVSIESLNTGIYILSTSRGALKFIK